MGYSGDTILIDFSKGGLVMTPNMDAIPAFQMVEGTRNLNLHNGGRQPRGGTAKDNATVISGSPRIMGLYDFRLRNGTVFKVFATADGKIYKNYTDTIKTGLGASKIAWFETFGNELFFCNGNDQPQTWDGVAAGTSNLTSLPSDWTGTNHPRQVVKHGRGNSERMWYLGCPTTPHRIYASPDGNGKLMGDASVITIEIETGDGFGITGGIEFGDRLIVFGKRKAYVINDASLTPADWGYDAAQWDGGVAHHRLLIRTPNDIVAMMEEGEIYSVTAAQEYGDYRMASLTAPAWMHKWIQDNLNLGLIEDFHGIYDPLIRAVRLFVVRSGQTQADTCLVYFIDRPPDQAWMIQDNLSYDSAFKASCSALFRKSPGIYKVYTGAYNGFAWETETNTRNDDGNAFYAGYKMPDINTGNPRHTMEFSSLRLIQQPSVTYSTQLRWSVDSVPKDSKAIPVTIVGGTVGTFVIGTDKLGGANLLTDSAVDLGEQGKRLQLELYNSVANQKFFHCGAMIDYRDLGASP